MTGVEHEEDHVGLGEDFIGTDLRVEIKGVALVGGATTGGIDERELRLRTVRLGAGKPSAHRVAGRTGDFTDDETGGAEQAIAERALADVRATGKGEANRAGAFFTRGRRLRAEEFDDQRLQLGDAAAMFGGDEERLAKTKRKELGHQSVALFGVGLVGDDDDLLASLAKHGGDFQIEGGAAFGSVDDKKHERGGGEGEVDLLFHGVSDELRRQLGAIQTDAAGIHQGIATFEDVGRDEVTRDPRLIVHNRDASSHQTVEEAALTDVGPSHDGYRARNFCVPFHGRTVRAT